MMANETRALRSIWRCVLVDAPWGMEAESAESTRVLRGAGNSAEGVRQLAGEVQGRTATTGAGAAVSAWGP